MGFGCKPRLCSRSSVKTDGNRPWADLPQGIVETIINRLHFCDQVRALAVCKSWQLCKDYIKCSDRLPWVVSYCKKYLASSKKVVFICKLYDPYSQKIVSEVSMDVASGILYVLDSRHGWLLLGDEHLQLFLHNPFTNEQIHLPLSADNQNMQAMISDSPTSPQCGIFMLSIEEDLCFQLDACYLSDLETSSRLDIEEMDENVYICSMLFMKGNCYYALLEDDELNIYVLKGDSSELLASGFPEPYESYDKLKEVWLMEVDENLIMVRMDLEGKSYKWMIFRFDWSEMSWVVETNLKSCAIYIAWNIAFSAPLTSNCGEILEGCKLFYLDYCGSGGGEIKCVTLSEAGGTQIESSEYGWINISSEDWSFIEPSYF